MSKSDASKLILDFLTESNCPYGLNDILEKCGKQLGKALVQKTLDSLVEKNKIVQKCYGKQKIFFIKQSTDLSQLKQQLQSCTQKLAQSQHNVKLKESQYHELELKLKNLSAAPCMQSLEAERDKLFDDIRELNEKLRQHEAAAAQIKYTPTTAKQIEKRYVHVAGSYRKRKRICVDMLDAILEGYPKPKKALIEDIGVETDEAVGFAVNVKH